MQRHNAYSKRIIISAVIIIILIKTLVFFIFFASHRTDNEPELHETPSTSSPHEIHLQNSLQGPLWNRTDAESVKLTPLPEPIPQLDWTVKLADEHTHIEGRGLWNTYPILLKWELVQDQPQANFHVEIRDVAPADLKTKVQLKLSLPSGTVNIFHPHTGLQALQKNQRIELNSYMSPTIFWHDPHRDDYFSIAFIEAIEVEVHHDENQHTHLAITLWSPDPTTHMITCIQNTHSTARTLSARLGVVFDRMPSVAPSYVPHGHTAALLPYLQRADHHSTPWIRNTAEYNSQAWEKRARTLLFGHSDAEDPRYGNGGLQGSRLGGTLEVPEHHHEYQGIKRLSQTLIQSNTELHSNDNADEKHLGDCSPQLGSIEEWYLDGTRAALIDGPLHRDYLEGLLNRRGVASFHTPFLAERNPLMEAFQHSLLSPESQGQWTLHPDFARALAHLQWLHQSDFLLVTSHANMESYWHHVSAVNLTISANGILRVENQSDRIVEGFSLLTLLPEQSSDAHALVPLKSSFEIQRRRHLIDDDVSLEYLWWDLAPATSYEFHISQGPTAPRWVVGH